LARRLSLAQVGPVNSLNLSDSESLLHEIIATDKEINNSNARFFMAVFNINSYNSKIINYLKETHPQPPDVAGQALQGGDQSSFYFLIQTSP
jgi:hypothetical protein